MVGDKFRFLNFLSKNPVTDSGRSISGQFSLRIKLVTVIGTIGTESNMSVGSLRDLSEFDVHMILV